MGNSDTIKFWLDECCPLQSKASEILASYQYRHDWVKHPPWDKI